MTKTTRRQHYIPQFYLRQWVDESGGFFPIKIDAKKPPKTTILKRSGPNSFCCENFFYANETGQEDEIGQIIDSALTEIEGIFSKILPELEEKIVRYDHVTEEEKYHIAEFMMFLWLKGKQQREDSKKMTDHMVKEINKHLVHFFDKDPKTRSLMEKHDISKTDMIEFVNKGEYTVDFGNVHHMALMKDMQGFCNLTAAKHWRVYISKTGDFITTDSPYSDVPVSKEFWGNDFLSREQVFVLSPRVLIVATYPKNEGSKKFVRRDLTYNKDVVQKINAYVLMRSLTFGFHKDESILQELQNVVDELHNQNSNMSK